MAQHCKVVESIEKAQPLQRYNTIYLCFVSLPILKVFSLLSRFRSGKYTAVLSMGNVLLFER